MEMKSKRTCLKCMTTVTKAPPTRHKIVPLLWEGPKVIVKMKGSFRGKKKKRKRGITPVYLGSIERLCICVYIYIYSTNTSLLLHLL